MRNKRFIISDLRKIYFNKETGKNQLAMAEITGYDELASFADLRDYVMNLRYPSPQADKLESFGWVPTMFLPGDQTFKRKDGGEFIRNGCWRTGSAEAERDGLSVFYADVDNANPDPSKPIVTMEEVAARLNALAGPVPFFMYTSFSHTDPKPKFRVVIETDRDISRAEMAKMAICLNWEVFGQQADLSIYDPGDFVFAPPHQGIKLDQMQGNPLDVAAMLCRQATYEDELTITFGYWETHAPSHVPAEMSDDEAAAEEAKKFVDGWIGGQLFTAIYFDAAGKWCGSITVEPDEIADRIRWGEEWIRNFHPARVELRRPRRADWRYFVVSGSEIEEIAGPTA